MAVGFISIEKCLQSRGNAMDVIYKFGTACGITNIPIYNVILFLA